MIKTSQILLFPLLVLMIISFVGCDKTTEQPLDNIPEEIICTVSGVAQKGPFISGSSVSLYDLDSSLTASGKTFNAMITDDKGSFELKNILLSSPFVRLRVDGFYYNEVLGRKSDAPLTLYALANTADSSDVNVNLLTHLEMPRVEYLLSQGMPFDSAKARAQAEVLAVFSIQRDSLQSSESLNIFEGGDDNAKLLAVSLLLQGFRSEAELTELMSYMSMDLRTDGIISDSTLGSQIANHASLLDTARIRKDLEDRSAELNLSSHIPGFQKYISGFISNSGFPITGSLIEYPETGVFGKNILTLNDTVYYGIASLSLAANLPESASLKIRITGLSANPMWWYSMGSGSNWSITTFTGVSQTFTSVTSGANCDLHMMEFNPGRYLVEYYECTADQVTRKKIIKF